MGKAQKSMTSKAAFSMVSEASIGLLFLVLILGARILGDEEFGIFTFALAYVNIFGIIMEGGLFHVYTRVVGHDDSDAERIFQNVLMLQILFSLLGIVLGLVTIQALAESEHVERTIQILILAEGLRFVKLLLRTVFRTADRYDLEAVSVLFERIGLLVVSMSVLALGYGVEEFALAFLVWRTADVIVSLFMERRSLHRPRLRFDFSLWRDLLKQSVPFIITAAALLLLYKVDSILLGFNRSDAEVGWYGAAYRLLEGLYLFPKIFSGVLYPSFARYYKDQAHLNKLYNNAMRYLFFIGWPVMLVGIVLSEDLVLFVYGSEFINSAYALQILLVGLNIIFIHEIGFALMASINRQTVTLVISVATVILNIVMNLVLIPYIGFLGAAAATVMAEVFFISLYYLYTRHLGFQTPYLRLALKPILAGMTAAGVAHVIGHVVHLHVLVSLPMAAIVYFLALTLLQYWNADEIQQVQRFTRKLSVRVFGAHG